MYMIENTWDLKGVCGKNNMGYRDEKNWSIDAHRCQTFLGKMLMQRVLYLQSAKAVRFYKSNRYVQNIVKCGQNTSKI